MINYTEQIPRKRSEPIKIAKLIRIEKKTESELIERKF